MYAVALTRRMVSNSDVNVKWNLQYVDKVNDPKDHPIFKDKLLYGFLWFDRNFEPITPDIGYIELFERTSMTINGTRIDNRSFIELKD